MRTLVKTSAILAIAMIGYKFLGFIEKMLLAHQFGIGPAADAYLAGSSAVLLVGLLLNDIAGPALIPALIARKDQAQTTFAAAVTWTLAIMLPIAWLLSTYASFWARVFGPGFDAYTLQLTTDIIRICSWSIPLLSIASLVTAWFHARQAFVQPALADLALKIGPLIGLATLGGLSGLTYGLVGGAILRLLLMFNPKLPKKPHSGRQTGISIVLIAAWPLLLNTLVSVHLLSVIETAIASTISAGSVATFAYARRIVDTPVMIFPFVIARVVFPKLTELALEQQNEHLQRLLNRCIRLTCLITLPVMIVGMVLATPIIQLLLQRGAFDADSVGPTAQVMVTILPGLPALALSVLLVRFSYATGDTFWPSAIRFIGAGIQIGLALWWRQWGLAGLGWATTVSLWLETVLVIMIAFRAVGARPNIEWRFWGVVLSATAVACGCAWWLRETMTVPQESLLLFGYLGFISLLAWSSYLIIISLGRITEIQRGWAFVRRWRTVTKI